MTASTSSAANSGRRATILAKWRDATDIPLIILALCTIPLLVAEFWSEPTGTAADAIEIAYAVIWFLFVFDYFFELVLEEDRRGYVRSEWLAPIVIILSVPIPGNPLQILRSLRVLRIFRSVRIGAVVARGGRATIQFPKGKNQQLVLAGMSFLAITVTSAVAVFAVEKDAVVGGAGADELRITSIGDALWWSINTLTTIGASGDIPQTAEGRWLALLPMLAGVGLVGVVAANLASRLLSRLGNYMPDLVSTEEQRLLTTMVTELERLHTRLDRLEAASGSRPGSPSE